VRYRWSPDAKYLAVQGTLYHQARSVLLVIETSRGKAMTLDSLALLSDYEFDWSPNSRQIAVSRPVRLADVEQVSEAELWVFDVEGRGAKLAPSSGFANGNPRWVDDKRLLFTRQKFGSSSSQRFVVDLVHNRSRR